LPDAERIECGEKKLYALEMEWKIEDSWKNMFDIEDAIGVR